MHRRAVALGLWVAMAFVGGCSSDENNGTGTSGSGGVGGSTSTGGAGGSSGGGSSAQDAGNHDGFVSCAPPTSPVDDYHANLVKTGSDGVLTFTLVQSDNAPPIRGINAWQLKITRADKSPVTSNVTAQTEMPFHIHPAGVQPDMTYDAAAGLYQATPMYFFMAGYWMAKFTVYEADAGPGAIVDIGTFFFCID